MAGITKTTVFAWFLLVPRLVFIRLGKQWQNAAKFANLRFLVILAKFLGGVGAKHQINHTNHNIQQRQSKTKHTRPHRETHTIHNAKENSRKPNNANLLKLPKNRQKITKIQW